MTYTAPWPAPASTGTVGLIQLLGDVQSEWEGLVLGDTAYDRIVNDTRDNLALTVPDIRVQMGDISNGDANLDLALLKHRMDIYRTLFGAEWFTVAGNHDLPGPAGGSSILTVQDWATYWGYASHRFAVEYPDFRVVFFNPSGTGTEMRPLSGSTYPCRPFTTADVAWLDTELGKSALPTLIMSHAQLMTPAQISEAVAAGGSYWRTATSTVPSGLQATEIRACLDAHPQVISWCHGHTHDPFDSGDENDFLYDTGSRKIVQVDAAATYSRPVIDGVASDLYREPVTFFLSVLDDGRTIETRYRNHAERLWDSNSVGRFHRLTATG